MWLYLIGGLLVLVGIAGGAFGGGIFSIVLIPLGVVVLVSAFGYAMWSRAAHGSAGADTHAHPSAGQPLPHAPRSQSAHVPTSPDALADARRAQQ